MPELPEIEVMRRELEDSVTGRKITGTEVRMKRFEKGGEAVNRRISGQKITGIYRHGKYLFLKSNQGAAALHFGLTGALVRVEGKLPAYTRFTFHLDKGGDLAYVSPRPFGMLRFVEAPERFIEEKKIGPDAEAVTLKELEAILKTSKGAVKAVLMDQERIAGIGNVYSDEILFQSRIHPASPASSLGTAESRRIFSKMKSVLKEAIKKRDRAKLPGDYLVHSRKKNAACPRCEGKIGQLSFAGRRSFYCPACQKK